MAEARSRLISKSRPGTLPVDAAPVVVVPVDAMAMAVVAVDAALDPQAIRDFIHGIAIFAVSCVTWTVFQSE